MPVHLKDGDVILFAGDSITDQGRRTRFVPLGQGFVKLFSELVTSTHPDWRIEYKNKGVLGNRISDLRNRWKDDVLDQEFNWLCIMIGINDVAGCLRDDPMSSGPELFRQILTHLLEETTREHQCRIVLMDPFYISTDHGSDSMRGGFLGLLPPYIEGIHQISREFNARLIRTQDIFQQHLKYREVDYFATEPVHPSRTGHLIIAHALFRELVR